MGQNDSNEQDAHRILNDVRHSWMQIPGVVGIGVGAVNGRRCLKVYFSDEQARQSAVLPREIEGYPVIQELSGPFRANS